MMLLLEAAQSDRGAPQEMRRTARECRLRRAQVPDAAEPAFALSFFCFFVFDFDGCVPEAVFEAAEAAEAGGTTVAARGACLPAFSGTCWTTGGGDTDGADTAGAAAFSCFPLAPVGGAEEPPIVNPSASSFATDFGPNPCTRAARSLAFLKGPFLVRSSMIA